MTTELTLLDLYIFTLTFIHLYIGSLILYVPNVGGIGRKEEGELMWLCGSILAASDQIRSDFRN